jgi:hypothetical protein
LNSTAAAAAYNSSGVYTVHVASARYFTSYQSYIYPAVLEVLDIAQQLASNHTVSAAIETQSLTGAQIGIIAQPAFYSLIDIAPLSFQARVFVSVKDSNEGQLTSSQLNTFGIVVSHLTQFFFNMILNGIFLGVGIYRNTTFRRLIKRKYPVKVLWTLATSLTITSFAIIYDEGWSLPASNFFALWATEWCVPLFEAPRGNVVDLRLQGVRLDQLQHCWRCSRLPPNSLRSDVHLPLGRDLQ